MTRLLLGVTLERICKAVLLLCLLHFVIIMILYFDVYAQHLDFFSRFNARNTSRVHPFSNSSRPNSTAPSYGPAGAEPPSPSAKPNTNRSVTEKPLQPCQEMPSGLGEMCRMREGGVGCWWGMSPEQGFPVVLGWRNPRLALVPAQLIATAVWEGFWESFVLSSAGPTCGSPLLFAPLAQLGAAGDHDLSCVLYCCHRPALALAVGRLLIEFSSPMSMERVQRENPDVSLGGKYTPPDCLPRQKVAILIPFRHREHHLKYWLHYLHPILRRQKVAYGIYIINQYGEDTFNRAKLLNVGFLEALKDDEEYDCFIFSDVDLIPMDDRNLYRCYEQPRHFAVGMDKFGFRLPYAGYFGGVSGLSKSQFLKINGFPNEYWGWGGEDDDIFNRISLNGMKVSRPDIRIGRYRMIKHERDKHNEPNPQRFTKIQNTKMTMKRDGISSLQYRLVEVSRQPMYTNITVEIGRPPPRLARG
uniref:Beta-1,4-galactosyltransferase n=1 Tax=Pavo cristatus TaxID=9049 RepID=A0A8C9FBF9_PAVCR